VSEISAYTQGTMNIKVVYSRNNFCIYIQFWLIKNIKNESIIIFLDWGNQENIDRIIANTLFVVVKKYETW